MHRPQHQDEWLDRSVIGISPRITYLGIQAIYKVRQTTDYCLPLPIDAMLHVSNH